MSRWRRDDNHDEVGGSGGMKPETIKLHMKKEWNEKEEKLK